MFENTAIYDKMITGRASVSAPVDPNQIIFNRGENKMATQDTNNPTQHKQGTCLYCEKAFLIKFRKEKLYCDNVCRNRAYKGDPVTLAGVCTASIGAISEVMVCADLLRRGFHVFRSVSPAAPCDIVILRDGELVRVEVTTVRRNAQGEYHHPKKKDAHKFDLLACVIQDENLICYEPLLD